MRTALRVALIFLLAFTVGKRCISQQTGAKAGAQDERGRIAGVWRGHSVCQVKDSPCHDEVNVYRFSSIDGRPNAFSVAASKIVDGKEIVMGSGEWKYDAEKHVVEGEKPPIRMTIEGKKMEGALTLPDGTIYRRIYLRKED
jgi:hypothetical protein